MCLVLFVMAVLGALKLVVAPSSGVTMSWWLAQEEQQVEEEEEHEYGLEIQVGLPESGSTEENNMHPASIIPVMATNKTSTIPRNSNTTIAASTLPSLSNRNSTTSTSTTTSSNDTPAGEWKVDAAPRLDRRLNYSMHSFLVPQLVALSDDGTIVALLFHSTKYLNEPHK